VFDPATGAIGRVNMVWPAAGHAHPTIYYRANFPPGSPFVDDWAAFREGDGKVPRSQSSWLSLFVSRSLDTESLDNAR